MEAPLANPYSTPAANLYGSAVGGSVEVVSASTIAQLAGTKPWIRFMSVVMWTGSALLGLLSCFYGLLGTVGASQFANNPAFKSNPAFAGNPNFLTATMIGTAVYMGTIALLIIYPAVKLWKYANRIGQLMSSRSPADLDAALTEQRRYWKFNGIMVIIGICLMVVGFIAFFVLIFTSMKAGTFPR